MWKHTLRLNITRQKNIAEKLWVTSRIMPVLVFHDKTKVSCTTLNLLGNTDRSVLKYTPQSSVEGIVHKPWCSIQKRYKRKRKQVDDHSSDSDDSGSDSDNEFTLDEMSYREDIDLPPSYRDLKLHLKSLRLDSVVGRGLNIARSKIDDYFLDSKLRLNGEKVLKKSAKLSVGDYVDLVNSVENGMMKFKRVRLLKIEEEKTRTDKMTLFVRVWKTNVTMKVEEKDWRHR